LNAVAVSAYVIRGIKDGLPLTQSKFAGVPYGSRTRVAAVKEKGPVVIQWNLAAWIALYRI
jgi:hypothetical protein